MNNGTTHWTVENLVEHLKTASCGYSDGTWGPLRPLGWTDIPTRIRLAWRVFTGKSDALTWPRGQ